MDSTVIPESGTIVPHIREFLSNGTPVEVEIGAIAIHEARSAETIRAVVQSGRTDAKEIGQLLLARAMVELFAAGRYTTPDGTFSEDGDEMYRLWSRLLSQAKARGKPVDGPFFAEWLAMNRIDLASAPARQESWRGEERVRQRKRFIRRATLTAAFLLSASAVHLLTGRGMFGSAGLLVAALLGLYIAIGAAIASGTVSYHLALWRKGTERWSLLFVSALVVYGGIQGIHESGTWDYGWVKAVLTIVLPPAFVGVYYGVKERRRRPDDLPSIHRIGPVVERITRTLFPWIRA